MKRLDRTEELALIASAQSGDQEAAHKLLDAMRGLVVSRARHLARGRDLDDFIQVGLLHCWIAIREFDPSFGVRLSTLAYRYVSSGVLGEIRNRRRSVRATCVEAIHVNDTSPAYDSRLAEAEIETIRLRCVDIVVGRLSDRDRECIESYRTGEPAKLVGRRLGVSRQAVCHKRKTVAARVRDAVQEMERAK